MSNWINGNVTIFSPVLHRMARHLWRKNNVVFIETTYNEDGSRKRAGHAAQNFVFPVCHIKKVSEG
jgi:hypothetical protein